MPRRLAILLLLLIVPLSLSAQSALFPKFSVTAGGYRGQFDTTARVDPETTGGEGTFIRLERDLGLDRSTRLERYTLQWRPFARHEFAATYFGSSRRGVAQIDREIVFRNRVYPVNAIVQTAFDLDSANVTYTYWARQSEHDGLGVMLGVAQLDFKADVTIVLAPFNHHTETANNDVPVALAGAQGRWAFGDHVFAEANAATLPRVKISGYTGRALTAGASLEYRPVRWLGVGAAYNYFKLDVDIARDTLSGTLGLRVRGPEGYVRLAF